MRTVTLEFLRHGPPHNQLLSPLTPYLVTCGDHPAVSVQMPFEHADLAERLRLLGAGTAVEPAVREAQLRELAQAMGAILAQVPGLAAELCPSGDPAEVTRLRLVLSANELALLPFELASAGLGLPGAGGHLALQTTVPICPMREIRRSGPPARWPDRCRILLAAASPAGVAPVPLEAHLLALRQAVEPWVMLPLTGDAASRWQAVSPHLELLTDASPRRLEQAMASGGFTHVHLLAHGAPLRDGDDRRYGLALHDDRDPSGMDVLDGERLAQILRPRCADGTLARPAVVTLATCDSGNVGGVISPGASLAHALHRADIPLVVASQFPLSFAGSVHLATQLYGPLLAGEDPCLVLDRLRRTLKALVPQHHDWAGLVVYAGLPPDLDVQLAEMQYQRAKQRIAATMHDLDALIRLLSTKYPEDGTKPSTEVFAALLKRTMERFAGARAQVVELLPRLPRRAGDLHGLLGGSEKRVADLLWNLERKRLPGPRRWREHLATAVHHYQEVFAAAPGAAWGLVQILALGLVGHPAPDDHWCDRWRLARLLAENDINHRDDQRPVWAMNNLIELAILALVPATPILTPDQAKALGEANVAALLARRERSDLEVHTLRRQCLRYADGFFVKKGSPASALADHLFHLLKG